LTPRTGLFRSQIFCLVWTLQFFRGTGPKLSEIMPRDEACQSQVRHKQQATTNKGNNSFNKDFKHLVNHVVKKKEKEGKRVSKKTVVERLNRLEAELSKILTLLQKGG